MVLACLFSLVMFQDDGHDVRFTPIPAGNVIELGSYRFEIPEGAYYTGADNVQHLFKLAGASFIPHAAGIFYSNASTWDWSVTVQHIPGRFLLAPKVEEAALLAHFSEYNLYTQEPINEAPNVIMPPTYDEAEQSFTLGLHYPPHASEDDGHDHNYVFIKKVWVTQFDAMIFSVRAQKAAFDDEFGVISDILTSVEVVPRDQVIDEDVQPSSYLSLLGVEFVVPEDQAATAQAETPAETSLRRSLFYSLGLILVAGVVLFMALQLRKDKQAD